MTFTHYIQLLYSSLSLRGRFDRGNLNAKARLLCFTRNDNFLSPCLTMLLSDSISLSMMTTEIFCGIFLFCHPPLKKFLVAELFHVSYLSFNQCWFKPRSFCSTLYTSNSVNNDFFISAPAE